jgi:hypothetical protein
MGEEVFIQLHIQLDRRNRCCLQITEQNSDFSVTGNLVMSVLGLNILLKNPLGTFHAKLGFRLQVCWSPTRECEHLPRCEQRVDNNMDSYRHMLFSGWICLKCFGPWVCRVCCSSENVRKEFKEGSCVTFTGPAKRFAIGCEATCLCHTFTPFSSAGLFIFYPVLLLYR